MFEAHADAVHRREEEEEGEEGEADAPSEQRDEGTEEAIA